MSEVEHDYYPVNQSILKQFADCPRKGFLEHHGWKFKKELARISETEKSFSIGSILHLALNQLHRDNLVFDKDKFSSALLEREIIHDIPSIERITDLMNDYSKFNYKFFHKMKLIDIEKISYYDIFYEKPLVTPKGKEYHYVRMYVTLDKLFQHAESDRYIIIDHKTSKKPSTSPDIFNLQLYTYTYIMTSLGYDISSSYLDKICFAEPKIPLRLANGRIKTSSLTGVTVSSFLRACKLYNQNPENYADTLEKLSKVDSRFSMDKFTFNKTAIERYPEYIRPLVEEHMKWANFEDDLFKIRDNRTVNCYRCQYNLVCETLMSTKDKYGTLPYTHVQINNDRYGN